MEYLKHFLVASNPITIIPPIYFLYYMKNYSIVKDKINYSLKGYLLSLTLFLGFSNLLSFICFNHLGINNRLRFFITSIITLSITITYVNIKKVYYFTKKQWEKYYLSLTIAHLFMWNIIIYNLYLYFN